MAVASFELGTKTQVQDKFKTLLVQLKQAGLTDFDWLREVIATTLEEDSRARLTDQALDLQAYNPLLVEENMASASRLLDTCLVQRKEIYQLEAQAIATGLDILTTSTTLERNYELAQVGLAANIRQAIDPETGELTVNLDDRPAQDHQIPVKLTFPVVASKPSMGKPAAVPDVADPAADSHLSEGTSANVSKIDRLESALRERQEAMRAALRERLALHNRAGSALNYGERVRFMRKVYLDNLRLAYQRMHATWRGLALVYGIKREKPNAGGTGSILEEFVEWLRTGMSATEASDRHEYLLERAVKLTLADHPSDSGGYHVSFSISRNRLDLFSSGEFSYAGSDVDPDAVRIVGMELGLVSTQQAEHEEFKSALKALNEDKAQPATEFSLKTERAQRLVEQWTVAMVIVPPPSQTRIGDEMLTHQPMPLRLDHVPFWMGGSTRPPLVPVLANGFVNASPLGGWRIRVSSEIHTPWLVGGLKELDAAYAGAGLAAALSDMRLYLRLRIAVRPSRLTMAAAGQS